MADSINYQLAKFVASYGKVSQIPESTCPEVSFVGRSNVGKSSIMNKLFGRKNLVKVSSTGSSHQKAAQRSGRERNHYKLPNRHRHRRTQKAHRRGLPLVRVLGRQ